MISYINSQRLISAKQEPRKSVISYINGEEPISAKRGIMLSHDSFVLALPIFPASMQVSFAVNKQSGGLF